MYEYDVTESWIWKPTTFSACLWTTTSIECTDYNMEESHATGEVKIPADADVDENFEFESVSCFVISKHSKPRRWIIQLLKWPYPFEN